MRGWCWGSALPTPKGWDVLGRCCLQQSPSAPAGLEAKRNFRVLWGGGCQPAGCCPSSSVTLWWVFRHPRGTGKGFWGHPKRQGSGWKQDWTPMAPACALSTEMRQCLATHQKQPGHSHWCQRRKGRHESSHNEKVLGIEDTDGEVPSLVKKCHQCCATCWGQTFLHGPICCPGMEMVTSSPGSPPAPAPLPAGDRDVPFLGHTPLLPLCGTGVRGLARLWESLELGCSLVTACWGFLIVGASTYPAPAPSEPPWELVAPQGVDVALRVVEGWVEVGLDSLSLSGSMILVHWGFWLMSGLKDPTCG